MRLLTLDRMTEEANDVVLRGSCGVNLIVFLISATLFGAVACLAIGIIPHEGLPVTWLWCIAGIFFLWMAVSFFATVMSIQNKVWFCRARGDTLWIRCSGKPDGLALELNRGDLAWAQPLKLTYVLKGRGMGRRYEYYQYIDLGLSPAAAAAIDACVRDEKIDKAIRDEFYPPVPVYKGWPWLVRPGVLRTCWPGISPGLGGASKFFAQWTQVRPLQQGKISSD